MAVGVTGFGLDRLNADLLLEVDHDGSHQIAVGALVRLARDTMAAQRMSSPMRGSRVAG